MIFTYAIYAMHKSSIDYTAILYRVCCGWAFIFLCVYLCVIVIITAVSHFTLWPLGVNLMAINHITFVLVLSYVYIRVNTRVLCVFSFDLWFISNIVYPNKITHLFYNVIWGRHGCDLSFRYVYVPVHIYYTVSVYRIKCTCKCECMCVHKCSHISPEMFTGLHTDFIIYTTELLRISMCKV